MKALILHNAEPSSAGRIAERLEQRGYALTHRLATPTGGSVTLAAPLPSVNDFDAVVALGGPALLSEVSDETWVREEARLLRAAYDLGIPVLGVCLGGQLVALAHGGGVRRAAQAEFGWIEVDSIEPGIAGSWLAWHLDTWDIPEGATSIATSPHATQAFRLERTLAVQFHPEITFDALATKLAGDDPEELAGLGIHPGDLLRDTAARDETNRRRAYDLVDRWLDEPSDPITSRKE